MKDDRVITPQARTGLGYGGRTNRDYLCARYAPNSTATIHLKSPSSWHYRTRIYLLRTNPKMISGPKILLGALHPLSMSSENLEWDGESGSRLRR
ncbi:hypothetical protein PTRG_10770 [Pyrenophora tritici-repentis Pt-1C-BFP]|uniref:Uncharacterized protein n=1 Tax=Pyrenophora tritici-repentis (strain Pt-1C-BFP) TaxID=426418 RepID=B2WLB0_PYRTR|nr:uncharacterized protein PTRG_10770 [Pyrenophora tritici-repentis Pt-1C-BFP]EDU43820.1 hypothetical protein PTRG_10770 [Pyrenophora tritici-repentis Pt-1C-BFP]